MRDTGERRLAIVGRIYEALKNSQPLARFARWLAFGVVVALAPILANAAITYGIGRSVNWTYLIGSGQLLLPAVGLSATAIGDLLLLGRGFAPLQLGAGLICFFNVLIASAYFALISGNYVLMDFEHRVVEMSMYSYIIAVFCSGTCYVLAELERRDESA